MSSPKINSTHAPIITSQFDALKHCAWRAMQTNDTLRCHHKKYNPKELYTEHVILPQEYNVFEAWLTLYKNMGDDYIKLCKLQYERDFNKH